MAEYIEREAAIESIMSQPPDAHYPHWYSDKIKALPAANVAPVRHAYWVPEEHADQVSPTTIHRYTGYYCSECGRRLIGYKNQIDAPYCNCGGKMDGDG